MDADSPRHKTNTPVYIGMAAGALFWFADSVIDIIFFEDSTLREQILSPEPMEVWVRLFVFFAFTAFGLYARSAITRLTKAGDALAVSEERSRAVTETATDAVIMMDQAGLVTFWNPAAERMFGYSRGEALGENLHRLILPPRHRQAYSNGLARFWASGEPGFIGQMTELYALRKDGSEFPVEVSLSAFKGQGGVNFAGIVRDITSRKKAEYDVQASRAFLDSVINGITEPVMVIGTDYRVSLMNKSARDAYLRRYDNCGTACPLTCHGVSHGSDTPCSEGEGHTCPLKDVVASGRPATAVHEHISADGETSTVEILASPVTGPDGSVRVVVETSRDVTERVRAEKSVRENEGRLRQMFEKVELAAVMLDNEGRITYCNDYLLRLSGWDKEEALGMDWFENFLPEEHREDARIVFTCLMKGRETPSNHENPIITRSGEERLVSWHNTILRDAKGAIIGTTSIGEDMTERRQREDTLLNQQRMLVHMAHHDGLTGLPNRLMFNDRLTMAVAHAERYGGMVGLLFVDLDGFKQVNDTLGHAAGDQLLKDVAWRLTSSVRDCDTVARLGGDEFGVVVPQIEHGREALGVAQRIFETLAEPFDIGGAGTHITLSIGIALYPKDAPDANTLFRNADCALYRAKELGKNRSVLFGHDMPAKDARQEYRAD